MNVSFTIGEMVNGWEVINVNGCTHFVVKKDDIRIFFETTAGEGVNYSNIRSYTDGEKGRQYRAQRYLYKYVSLVQGFSNTLYKKYLDEQIHQTRCAELREQTKQAYATYWEGK
jgi:hypothetical protein